MRGAWRRLAQSRRGGMATVFAIAAPVLAVLACGAADLASVASDRGKMQDAADAAALDGATQLSVANTNGAADRAQQFAMDQLGDVARRVSLTPAVTVPKDASTITVAIHGHRASFFGNLLPMGGWNLNAKATAEPLSRMPMCLLTTNSAGATGGGALTMQDQSKISASGCLVHSNSDLTVPDPADLDAGAAEAVLAAAGQITPAPQTGAPAIPDPYANVNWNIPPICNPLDLLYDLGVNVLFPFPGIHCGNITVRQNATALLLPGNHYFLKGVLNLQQNATLKGDDVVLIFDKDSYFQFQDHSQIKLQGRQSGPYAGFVIATTPANTHTFDISSDSARLLLGTIYIPNALLTVSGGATNIADQSSWTVIIAKGVQLSGSPDLVLNSNYNGLTLAPPAGLGPRPQGARLVR
jgi:Flp pilus assembly protein TadG